ncbi:MAG: acyltransferase [Henriciella sp.]|nr:acyltransferase [Henriciella sp.]
MKYRAEIDGLRALAVAPGILFHAGVDAFSGGYVGVDVFFVISGYLITTILIEEIENGRFSIINFYERRARRILPVLFFIMLLCVPFAWMWMLPSQMEEFSSSLIAVSLFVSNILFWRESDYFAAAAEEKPLLHTWSLAVEEQYYLLFPIFLILVWRFGKKPVFWIIVAMAAISLLLSEWGWRNTELANFYLAPTRAWELFAGSIAAFAVQKYGVQKNNALASLGLGAILFAIFVYDKNTPFPSVYALVPVLGTVLLILYADKETYAAKLLSRSLFVGIGLISYSAYLWHQPLFAFSKIIWLDLHGVLAFALVLITFPLAYLSWRFVETPFRDKSKFGRGHIFTFSLAGILFFSAIGIFGLTSNGFESRQAWNDHYILTEGPQEKFNDACLLQNPQLDDFSTCRASQENLPTIALIGDSHSFVLYEAMAARFPNETIINIGKWECLPFVNDEHLGRGGCEEYQQKTGAFLDANPQIHTIILAGYWGYLSSGGFAYVGGG